MKLLVLAGGKGTRLKSVVPDVPKAIAPINNIPFLDFQINNWLFHGITSFIFVLGYKASLIQDHIISTYPKLYRDGSMKFVVEDQPLDTGGAIANAVKELNIEEEDFLVTNADTWLSDGFVDIWQSSSPSIAIIKVPNTSRFGEIKCRGSKVHSIEEKNGKNSEGFINAGLFLFNSKHIALMKEQIFSLERDLLPILIKRKKLNSVSLNTNFIDIGIPEDYNRFCKWIESGKKITL
jgi:NDP-sugar pyrophosphorylase family protein